MPKKQYQEFFYNQGYLIKVLFALNGNGHYKVKVLSTREIKELPVEIDQQTVEKTIEGLQDLPRDRADETTDIISYLTQKLNIVTV